MSRERRFCPYCGCVIKPDALACYSHSDLPGKYPHTALETVCGTSGTATVADLERAPDEAMP